MSSGDHGRSRDEVHECSDGTRAHEAEERSEIFQMRERLVDVGEDHWIEW